MIARFINQCVGIIRKTKSGAKTVAFNVWTQLRLKIRYIGLKCENAFFKLRVFVLERRVANLSRRLAFFRAREIQQPVHYEAKAGGQHCQKDGVFDGHVATPVVASPNDPHHRAAKGKL